MKVRQSSKLVWSVVLAVVVGINTVQAQYGQYGGDGDVIRGKAIGEGSGFGFGVGQRVGQKEFVVGSSLKVADNPHHPHRQALVVSEGHHEGHGHPHFGHHHQETQPFHGGVVESHEGFGHGGGYGQGHNEISHGHAYGHHPRMKHGHNNAIHSGYHGGPQTHIGHGGYHQAHHEGPHGHVEVHGHHQPHYNNHHQGHIQQHHGHPPVGHNHGGYVSFRGYGKYLPAYRVGAGVGHHFTGRGHHGSHNTNVHHHGYGYAG